MNALIPVPFHGDTLLLIDHDGEPFAAMRPKRWAWIGPASTTKSPPGLLQLLG
jgi:hypothetical protein